MTEFKPGDRVCSNVSGFYMGIPGTVTRKAQAQYCRSIRYVIELDIGKVIILEAIKIRKLDGN